MTESVPNIRQPGVKSVSLHPGPSFWDVISLRTIRENLTRPSLGLALFLIGFNIMYFHPLVFPATLYDPAELGSFRYLFLGWVLITLGAALESWNSGLWLIRRKPFWAFILILAISLMTIRSWFDGEPLASIITKSMAFYWLLLVPAIGLRAKNWAWLWLTFLLQMPIGAIYSLYTFFIEGATTRQDIVSMAGQNFLALCLYMGVFVFLFMPMVRGRVLVGASVLVLGLQLLQAYFFANRFTWFLVPVQLVLVFYIFSRLRKTKMALWRVMLLGLLALAAGSFALVSDNNSGLETRLADAYTDLLDRMLEKGTVVDTILENERWYEASSVISTMDGGDWILGKGLAARWSAPNFLLGEERFMVHNTWLNAFYWGGVLLFLAISIPVIWALHVMLRSRRAIALCCAGYLIIMNLKFPAYLITFVTHEWILACLVVGICVLYEQDRTEGDSRLASPVEIMR